MYLDQIEKLFDVIQFLIEQMPDEETWMEVRSKNKRRSKENEKQEKCRCCPKQAEDKSSNQNRWEALQEQDRDLVSGSDQIVL